MKTYDYDRSCAGSLTAMLRKGNRVLLLVAREHVLPFERVSAQRSFSAQIGGLVAPM
jgi:hypothetical protein